MAVLCRKSLRVSWILCLLISSITCLPAPEAGYGSDSPDPAPSGSMGSSSGSSYPSAGRLARSVSLSGVYYPTSQVPAVPSPNKKPGSMGYIWADGLGGSFAAPRAPGSLSGGYVSNAGGPGGEYNAGAYDIPAPQLKDVSGYDSEYSNIGLGTAVYSSSGSTDGDVRYTESSSDGESPEPVFSDVSNLEPVYSYRSRSSYQKGRNMFIQTRYTPGE